MARQFREATRIATKVEPIKTVDPATKEKRSGPRPIE